MALLSILTLHPIRVLVMPPFVLGVLDQFVSARMLDRYPELYTLGQRNIFVEFPLFLSGSIRAYRVSLILILAYLSGQFTRRIFWQWVATAVYHSVVSSQTSLPTQAFRVRYILYNAYMLFFF
jgi:phospholipid-transporting ATPase